jgi:hypothetical protein
MNQAHAYPQLQGATPSFTHYASRVFVNMTLAGELTTCLPSVRRQPTQYLNRNYPNYSTGRSGPQRSPATSPDIASLDYI